MLGTGKSVRKYERAAFLCQVELSVGSANTSIPARSLDISLGGVGLLSQVMVATGQSVSLAFHVRTPTQIPVVEHVQGRVAHVRTDVDGNYLGVEFHEPLQRSRNPNLTRKVETT